jgi:hypothetical protein
MKKHTLLFLCSLVLKTLSFAQSDEQLGLTSGLVYNQIGYEPKSQKIILFLDNQSSILSYAYTLTDQNQNIITSGLANFEKTEWRRNVYSIDLSSLTTEGNYNLTIGNYNAPIKISSNFIRDIQVNDYFDELFLEQRTLETEILPILNRNSTDVTQMSIDAFTNSGKYITKKGGWKDAHSNDQHLVHSKFVTILLTAYEENKNLFESSLINGKPKIINEAIWGLNFLLSIQSETGYFYGRLSSDQYTNILPIRGVINDSASFYNLQGCAALAQGYTVLKNYDQEFAAICLNAAIKAWDWYIQNPEIHNNSYSYWTARYDAKLLAAYELWRATGDAKYKDVLDEGITSSELKSPIGRPWEGWWHSNKGNVETYDYNGWFGMENFLLNSNILMLYGKYYNNAPESVKMTIDNQVNFLINWLNNNSKTPYNFYDIFLVDFFGMSGDAVLAATGLLYLGDVLKNNDLFNYGLDHFDFALGKNPLGKSYISKIGTNLHNNLWKQNTSNIKGSVVAGIYTYNNLPTANANLTGDVNAQGWKCDEVLMHASTSSLFNFAILDKKAKENVTSVISNNNEKLSSNIIYPNPVINEIFVSEKYSAIEIFDLSGKLILHIEKYHNKIDISVLHSGLYIVKIYSEKGTLTQKIIKN